MADPFQNVSAAGPDFIGIFAHQLEVRAAEPDMVGIVEAYLDDLPWDDITLAVELGCGTGPVARRMARQSSRAQVIGIEPSPELVKHAQDLAEGIANLRFETGTARRYSLRTARQTLSSSTRSCATSWILSSCWPRPCGS